MTTVQERLKLSLNIATRSADTSIGQSHPPGIHKATESEVSMRYNLGSMLMESTNTGMEVVQAIRLSDNLPVVVKIRDRPRSFKTPELEREWRRTTEVQLGMPKTDRLCHFYEVLETPKHYYIVMEKVEGKDLFEVMLETKPELDEAKEIVRQVLEALNEFHVRGRIHKDVKMENVMVNMGSISPPRRRMGSMVMTHSKTEPSPAATKLIDFDTAMDWEPSSPKAKEVLGTDGYIAPEAYLGQYSPASDIYAAGVVMYKLLVGEFPTREEIFDDKPGENWVGSPSMKRIHNRLMRESIDFTKSPFDKDSTAADLCCKLLAFNAEDRPSAEDALKHEWFFVEDS